jgi:hypothetical protein
MEMQLSNLVMKLKNILVFDKPKERENSALKKCKILFHLAFDWAVLYNPEFSQK